MYASQPRGSGGGEGWGGDQRTCSQSARVNELLVFGSGLLLWAGIAPNVHVPALLTPTSWYDAVFPPASTAAKRVAMITTFMACDARVNVQTCKSARKEGGCAWQG